MLDKLGTMCYNNIVSRSETLIDERSDYMAKIPKLNMDVFREKYPLWYCTSNEYITAESIGYLRCLKTYFPALNARNAIDNEIAIRTQWLAQTIEGVDDEQWHTIPEEIYVSMDNLKRFIDDASSDGYEFRITGGRVEFRVHVFDNPYQE